MTKLLLASQRTEARKFSRDDRLRQYARTGGRATEDAGSIPFLGSGFLCCCPS